MLHTFTNGRRINVRNVYYTCRRCGAGATGDELHHRDTHYEFCGSRTLRFSRPHDYALATIADEHSDDVPQIVCPICLAISGLYSTLQVVDGQAYCSPQCLPF